MKQPINISSRTPAGCNAQPIQRITGLCDTKISVREYCPITGNKPMICTRGGFAASCEKFQELERKKRAGNCPAGGGDHLTKYCTICKSDFPPENVTFIDVDRTVAINQIKKKERKMPKTNFTAGTCESCGGEKKVSGHYGKQVCYSCLAFRISAKNSPELVIKALNEFGHLPDEGNTQTPELKDYVTLTEHEKMLNSLSNELSSVKKYNDSLQNAVAEAEAYSDNQARNLADLTRDLNKQIADAKWFEHSHTALVKAEATVDDQAKEIDELKKQLENLEKENDTPWHATVRKILGGDKNEDLCQLAKRRMQVMEKLEYSYEDESCARVDAEAKIEDQAREIGELNIIIETLKESIRAYQSEEDARLPQESMSWPQSGLVPDTDVVEQIAWTLAEGTIAGTITGVSLDDIRRLRALV